MKREYEEQRVIMQIMHKVFTCKNKNKKVLTVINKTFLLISWYISQNFIIYFAKLHYTIHKV